MAYGSYLGSGLAAGVDITPSAGFQAIDAAMAEKNKTLWARIANNDYTAWLEALRSGDPDFRMGGAVYIRRAMPDDLLTNPSVLPGAGIGDVQAGKTLWMSLTPDEQQFIFGGPFDYRDTSWYQKEQAERAWLDVQSQFPMGRVGYGTSGIYVIADNMWWYMTPAGDFVSGPVNSNAEQAAAVGENLVGYGRRLSLSQLQDLVRAEDDRPAPGPIVDEGGGHYIPTTDYTPPPAPAGPPPGWRSAGPGAWWGPDGLYYEGNEPWNDPRAQGRSINATAAPDVPPPSGAPSVDIPSAIPFEAELVNQDFAVQEEPPPEYVPTYRPVDRTLYQRPQDMTAPTATPVSAGTGMGLGTMAVAAAALYFLFGRKR